MTIVHIVGALLLGALILSGQVNKVAWVMFGPDCYAGTSP